MSESKSSSIPWSHTSYHNSGRVNQDFIGKSGRVSINNTTDSDGKGTVGKFERADGSTVGIKK